MLNFFLQFVKFLKTFLKFYQIFLQYFKILKFIENLFENFLIFSANFSQNLKNIFYCPLFASPPHSVESLATALLLCYELSTPEF